MNRSAFRLWSCTLVAGALAACSGGNGVSSSTPGYGALPASGSSPIQHIIVVVQENRTFNDFFATFPGATGTTTGEGKSGKGKHAKDIQIPLAEVNLEDKLNLNHLYKAYLTAYDGGKMDGFNQIKFTTTGKNEGNKPYQYVNPYQVEPYWTLATTYALANMMFSTQGSGSFTAHQDLIRGGTELNGTESMIDDPTSAKAWGCDSPPGTVTSLLTTSGKYERDAGPLPCTTDFPSSGTYETLADLMDAANVSWKYYVPKFVSYTPGALWNAFDVISAVRYGSEWGTNVNWPEKNIFKDITGGTLPAVSWVIPDGQNSDHPGYGKDTGPSWVTSVVNAVGGSSYWDSTAVIVLWDDWGGFYDPVPPQQLDNQGGPGFRVPMIAVSPYAIPGDISQTVYGFGSVVRFIEDTFNLGRLGTTDETSTSISDMFNFNQTPRAFTAVKAKYSREYFLRQPPSNLPVDTQ